ncbi:MAG: arginine--tRNA ligase [Candidatus Kapabacteria bacterium]|nr:arginine--tRNA ligase [Candidatus Kapabacteria bacterium]
MYGYLTQIFQDALAAIGAEDAHLVFESPKVESHGDAATNVAMTLSKKLGKPPRTIAESIIAALNYDTTLVYAVEIAGPGFINIRLSARYFTNGLQGLLDEGAAYGANTSGAGKRANVEYVSANPTGPLHPGHARNTMLGDCIANLYRWSGYGVTREYYFNNAGNQMNNLARSIHARYRQLLGEKDYPFDEENGYKGAYIFTIAEELVKSAGDSLKEPTDENLSVCRKKGEEWCFASILNTLARLNVKHDVFFNEHSLYADGKITETVGLLRDKGLVYEQDGATYIRTSELGLEKDRVIIKSTGEPTYRLPDMAYHAIKCQRGDDIIVDIFGSDHAEVSKEVVAGVKALGYDTTKIHIILHQMVRFVKDGAEYKLSKRNGEQYTLDDLMDDVGVDVVRYFYSMRSADTQLVFDINLAQEQSDKNPVFYLQYAHARCANLFAKAQEKGVTIETYTSLDLLIHPAETALIKTLLKFPLVVQRATQNLEPHTIADYLRDVAAALHVFYHECRILDAEPLLMNARFALTRATQTVLKNGLAILGVNAPDKM